MFVQFHHQGRQATTKNKSLARALFILLLFLLSLVGSANAESYFYVFTDKKGNTVMLDHIPPEYAQQAYRIVNSQGVTVEEVPARGQQIPRAKQSGQHSNFLRSFSSEQDVREHYQRQIAHIDERMKHADWNVQRLQGDLDSRAERVQQARRRGEAADERVMKEMRFLRSEMEKHQRYWQKQQVLKQTAEKDLQRDLQRFRQLQRR